MAQCLRELTDRAEYARGVALVEDIDLAAESDPNLLYYAGVCLGSIGRHEIAIAALKRAAERGYAPFWCAYHLGLFEMRRGGSANAAFYFVVSLLANPGRTDLYPLLSRIAPGFDLALLRAAQGRATPDATAAEAYAMGASELEGGRVGVAAACFTMALALDRAHQQGRMGLSQLAPDVSFAVLPAL